MSTIADFNRIEDCDKIDPLCIDAYVDFDFDPENETGICLHTPWGGNCLDLTDIVKAAETCTTLYLSPENNPNCLVYEPECGDNICIHGDDLSRIISMRYLKDVTQATAPSDGIVYMYNGATNLFEPYNLKSVIGNINTAIQNINATLTNHGNRLTNHENRITNNENTLINHEGRISDNEHAITNHENRLQAIELKLTPPSDAPNDVKVVFGNINEYSDPNVVISEGSGTVTTLDKTHGLYTHTLASNAYGDEIFG